MHLQIWTAIKYEFITVVVAVTTLVLMWVFLGTAEDHGVGEGVVKARATAWGHS